MFELRHLKTFRELSQQGSYSAAARALGYTQPAVSQQMRALEQAAGTPLIIRDRQHLRLTQAGEILAQHANTILSAVGVARDEIAAVAGLHAGRVRLIAFPSGSAALVPAAIRELTAEHPEIRVSLVEAEPPDAIAALRAGDCDIALTFTYGDDPDDRDDLYRLPLLDEELLAVLPSGHPHAADPWVRLADLADESWIAGCPKCRHNLVEICAAAGFEPDIHFATDDNVAAQSLVAAGLGVSLMPRLVLTAAQHPGVVVKPTLPGAGRRVMALTWRDAKRVPAVAAMLDALVASTAMHQGVVLAPPRPFITTTLRYAKDSSLDFHSNGTEHEPPSPTPEREQHMHEISTDELKALVDAGDVLLVDTLGPQYFEDKHLPGAINIPHTQIEELWEGMLPDRDATIVAYCRDRECRNSDIVGRFLIAKGYTDVREYSGGKKEWEEAGHAFETGPAAVAS